MRSADFLKSVDKVAVDEIGESAKAVEGDCLDGFRPIGNVIDCLG
jgi:hypothetical protein